jgi:hypothetical protein
LLAARAQAHGFAVRRHFFPGAAALRVVRCAAKASARRLKFLVRVFASLRIVRFAAKASARRLELLVRVFAALPDVLAWGF